MQGTDPRMTGGPATSARPAEAGAKEKKAAIREKAEALGFDAVGFCSAAADARDADALANFIAAGRHGDMAWMAQSPKRRVDPKALWPVARTIVSLAVNYAPAGDPLAYLRARERAVVSVYARGRDYHKILKKRLKALARWMAGAWDCEVKVFVDTAPVMEKPVAARAGIGWQGKHSNLISPVLGNWLFLGEVFTTLALPPDRPAVDHCGSCDACQRACPTDALAEPYRLDVRRCISYLTIEHKGTIAPDLMERMGNRVYGCDDCLAVCPWNKFATPVRDEAFLPRAELVAPRLADLAGLDDAAFREMFSGTAIKRTGRERFLRNVLIAIGNSGDTSLAAAARDRLGDASELVRQAAAWASARLGGAPAHGPSRPPQAGS